MVDNFGIGWRITRFLWLAAAFSLHETAIQKTGCFVVGGDVVVVIVVVVVVAVQLSIPNAQKSAM